MFLIPAHLDATSAVKWLHLTYPTLPALPLVLLLLLPTLTLLVQLWNVYGSNTKGRPTFFCLFALIIRYTSRHKRRLHHTQQHHTEQHVTDEPRQSSSGFEKIIHLSLFHRKKNGDNKKKNCNDCPLHYLLPNTPTTCDSSVSLSNIFCPEVT